MKNLSLILLFLFPLSLAADLNFEPVVASYRVKPVSSNQMDLIADGFEIVHRDGEEFEVYVPQHRLAEFLSLAPQARQISDDIRRDLLETLAADESATGELAEFRYRSWSEVEGDLHRLSERYPQLVHLSSYGKSKNGRPLYVLKISDNAATDENEPQFLMTSATHGDELITVEVLSALIEELLAGYGHDERLTRLVDDNELYFVPVVNPDGFSQRSRYAGGVDPNRAYPRIDGGQPYQATCIEHLISFFHSKKFVGSLDFHASGRLAMYPWGYSRESTADEGNFDRLAREMVKANDYEAGQISRILYIAPGSSADYYYWKNHTLAFGIELADSKVPSASRIPQVVEEAREMTWRFIELAGGI